MTDNIKNFDDAHNEKLKKLSPEERAKAGLKKLAQEMAVNGDAIPDPKGLASGKSGKNGEMIIHHSYVTITYPFIDPT